MRAPVSSGVQDCVRPPLAKSACELGGEYRRRDPRSGVLHRVLSEHLLTFLARIEEDESRPGLPRHVRRELIRAHECGVLAHGFARLHCAGCRKDELVPFSCKGRGFCPSCGGRRMAESAAHLVDHVLPSVPVRQWVLSMPWRVRYLLACDVELCRAVRRCFLRTVFGHYRERAGPARVRTGAVNIVQRFGSALNLNIHFHALVLDGTYVAKSPFARPVFQEAAPLEDEDVSALVRALRDRILRLLRRRGYWDDPGEEDASTSPDHDSLLPFLSSASIQGRVALGPEAGQRVERLGHTPGADSRSTASSDLCASLDGFSLHAKVRVAADERERLEHLARYVCRPALSSERLSLDERGRVLLELRHPWRDGTTHIVFDPLVFLERLAALVPHPREHRLTYHGVLAPASSWRDLVVPTHCPESEPAEPAVCAAPGSPDQRLSSSSSPLPSTSPSTPLESVAPSSPPSRYSWAELLRRVFKIDVLCCPTCGSRRRLIALRTPRPVVHRILQHLGLPADPPTLASPRSPPQLTFAY